MEEESKKNQIENYERDLTHQHYIKTWSIDHDGEMKEAMNWNDRTNEIEKRIKKKYKAISILGTTPMTMHIKKSHAKKFEIFCTKLDVQIDECQRCLKRKKNYGKCHNTLLIVPFFFILNNDHEFMTWFSIIARIMV